MSQTAGSGDAHRELREYAARLEAWLSELGYSGAWRRLAFFERDCSQPDRWDWTPGTEVDAERFTPRFGEIVRSSARDWINLVAVTISAETLICAVEWFPDTGGNTRRPGHVAVNLSSELEHTRHPSWRCP